MRKKKRKVTINIEFNLDEKFVKVIDYDYLGNGGGMSGKYKNKEDFLNAFNEYFEKYICVNTQESDDK